jgi:hypothetical protein
VFCIEGVFSITQLQIRLYVVCPQNKAKRNAYNTLSPVTVLKSNQKGNEDEKK